ncbi:methyltransferase MtaB domain-containing protein [Sunxiuqinia indica]|uniref:methyltransferase MtaB domain-containing protein n=1 Tax=Sunxiuqinia indica TaxID=2692584 RepID=UPI00135B8AE8|nr:methyltransferase MtaB domain-containing protein [Sunxiuqinia indica]
MKYKNLIISSPQELMFGKAPSPVKTRRGLIIGGGQVYSELNFTLPTMSINSNTVKRVNEHYREIAEGALERALHLNSKGVVLEFETLLEMTKTPQIGVDIVSIMNEVCEKYYQKHGLASEIRLTPNDLREFERPAKQRTSELIAPMMELFERGMEAGGDLVSIESTGGKEVSDDALMMCDIKAIMFALSVLGVRDMQFLWKKIVGLANKQGKIAAGDSACGFANTAMVLAEKKYIPKVFAALVRVISVVRSIVAMEEGAVGPDKDCGYEGPFLKAITGIPISMEGKTAACAHFSPIGNIASACTDLWSNESVQNIKLLSGMAPTAYMEQLEYDVRLMNVALKGGDQSCQLFQQLMVDSDVYTDPQALVLAPENVIRISKELLKGDSYVANAKNGALATLDIIEEAIASGQMELSEMETAYLPILREDLNSIPDSESEFIDMMLPLMDQSKFILEEYGL